MRKLIKLKDCQIIRFLSNYLKENYFKNHNYHFVIFSIMKIDNKKILNIYSFEFEKHF